MRFFASISYNGAGYSGWQIQKNGRSIEEELENALSVILNEPIDVHGAGRTDSEVNAIGYIAHFDTDNDIVFKEPGRIIYKTNAILPANIVLNDIIPVDADRHARFDAVKRTYRYFVHTAKDPFVTPFSLYYKFPLNLEKMNMAAQYLLGEKNFSCFEKLHGSSNTSICNVTEAKWEEYRPLRAGSESTRYYVFTISANRFLRNMVRAIVGSLLEIGRGKKEPEWILELLSSGDRCSAGQSVPGRALFFTGIEYNFDLKNNINK